MKKHECIHPNDKHDFCRCKCGATALRQSRFYSDPHPSWETSGDCLGELVFREDECLRNDPDAKHVYGEYKRLTGRDLWHDTKAATQKADWGDAFGYWLPDGWIYVNAYDGGSLYRGNNT